MIFVSEFLTSGAWPETPTGSLLTEGRAMAVAVLEDAVHCRIPVSTTWDARIGRCPVAVDQIATAVPETEPELFRDACHRADVTFVIAPETDGILLNRWQQVRDNGGTWCGAGDDLIRLATDKLAFHDFLVKGDIPTIPTAVFDGTTPFEDCGSRGRSVVKLRDGAGSQSMRILESGRRESPPDQGDWIVQPFIGGSNWSMAAIRCGSEVRLLPAVRQRIGDDFAFLGGDIDCRRSFPAIERVVTRLLETLPRDEFHGTRGALPANRWTGFVGVDIIVPHDEPDKPLVVELNPRLTTSYIGYRRLYPRLLEGILFGRPIERTTALPATLTFRADGTVGEPKSA